MVRGQYHIAGMQHAEKGTADCHVSPVMAPGKGGSWADAHEVSESEKSQVGDSAFVISHVDILLCRPSLIS